MLNMLVYLVFDGYKKAVITQIQNTLRGTSRKTMSTTNKQAGEIK